LFGFFDFYIIQNDVNFPAYPPANNTQPADEPSSGKHTMITVIVTSFLTIVGTFITSYFLFRGKKVDHDKEECEKLRAEFDTLKHDHNLVKNRNKMHKAGLKMLLTMKKHEVDVKPSDIAVIEQILTNIENP